MRSTASRRLLPLLLACALIAAIVPAGMLAPAEAATYQVSIDTSSLSGTAANLAFDLTDSDAGVSTTVTISGFATNGTVGAVDAGLTTGGVSGSLPGTVTLTDTDFFNSLVQAITLGSALSFTLDMTTASSGGVPDAFAFSILDAAGAASLVDTDLDADVLLVLEANGTSGGNLAAAADTTPSVPVSATPAAAVPLPATALLLAAGAALVASRRR
jgi:hypothetical protein